jgi:hypothetical protein
MITKYYLSLSSTSSFHNIQYLVWGIERGRKSGAPDTLVLLCIPATLIHLSILSVVCSEFPSFPKNLPGVVSPKETFHIFTIFCMIYHLLKVRLSGWLEKSK